MSSNIREIRQEVREFERDLARLDRQLNNTRLMLSQSLLLLRRMNLPPEVNRVISMLVRARLVAEQYARSLQLLQAAYLAGGPAAWAFAAVTLGIATLTAVDLAMDVGGSG